jgi:hypothetical protein
MSRLINCLRMHGCATCTEHVSQTGLGVEVESVDVEILKNNCASEGT